jgi:signal transduction histidine kinase
LFALALVFALPRTGSPITTYGAASGLTEVAGLAAGLALLGAGAIVFVDARAATLGVLAVAAGLAWWAPDLIGWEGGPPLVRSLGAVGAPFYLPVLVHVVLGFPRGRLPSRHARLLVGGLYAVAAAISLGRAAFRDPYDDPYCWNNCTDNVFLVLPTRRVAAVLDGVWLAVVLVAGLALVVAAVWRLARASTPGRRTLLPVLLPAVMVAAAEAAYGAALLVTPAEDPQRAGFAAVFLARSAGAVALAAGLVWAVLDAGRKRAAVARVATQLEEASAPGTLAAVLARSLRDPQLKVGYWLPGEARHVDAEGRALTLPPPDSTRAATRIVRAGEPVAVVVHDATLLDGRTLADEIGAAARLAVDNERLRAEVLTQLEDLRASRARIVASGDAERRRLERDLHDGAQQRLVALSYELRLARAAGGADLVLDSLLVTAVDAANAALDELRDLAHGIYPAILAEAGLAAALATLADTAALPVELGELTRGRHPQAVETAAYLIVASGIEDAGRRDATYVGVSAVRRGAQLIVEVSDDGGAPRGAIQHLADRVGALGGGLEIRSTSLRCQLPCA